ncbi:MAG: hypothetical protein VX095_07060 [Pseudomonadota bacterium]|nr:hypothetical protein [Pseudomonadota bacterium]
MTSDPTDAPTLNSLPHPDDESTLATARDALLSSMSNVFIVGEEEFHVDACFLALYHQLKLEPGLRLHRMMSPKVDDIVELFNTVLADLSIEEARNQQANERHIIVMPDFGPNAGKEWMACESLVNTFPGSNVGMLAFSTIDNHDTSALQQLSLKSRNKLIRLTPMNRVAMERYLGECHERGALLEMLPSLPNSQWYALALEIAGLSVDDAPKQSVSDYDELKSVATAPTQSPVSPEFIACGDEPEEERIKERKLRVNWAALLPRVASLISASLIVLSAVALFLLVAGALHPPIWEATQAIARPLWDQLMAWLRQLPAQIAR